MRLLQFHFRSQNTPMKGTGAKCDVCRGSSVSTGAEFSVAPAESVPMFVTVSDVNRCWLLMFSLGTLWTSIIGLIHVLVRRRKRQLNWTFCLSRFSSTCALGVHRATFIVFGCFAFFPFSFLSVVSTSASGDWFVSKMTYDTSMGETTISATNDIGHSMHHIGHTQCRYRPQVNKVNKTEW